MNLSFPQMPEKLTSTEQDIVEYIDEDEIEDVDDLDDFEYE